MSTWGSLRTLCSTKLESKLLHNPFAGTLRFTLTKMDSVVYCIVKETAIEGCEKTEQENKKLKDKIKVIEAVLNIS